MLLLNRIKNHMLSFFGNISAATKIYIKSKKTMMTLGKDITDVWENREIDTDMNLRYEILTGLLMYQFHLTRFVINTKVAWIPEVGGFFIRSMTEVLINLRWLIEKGTDSDFESFRDYGLAKDAQFIDRFQKAEKDIEEKGGSLPKYFKEGLDRLKENTESQRYVHMIDVSLSDWRPRDTNLRKRAEQIDKECLELYESHFERQSALVHGQWNFLSAYFLKRCKNPLHNLHFIPKFDHTPPTVHIVGTTISLMVRSFNFWAKYLKSDYQTQIEKVFFGKNITPTDIGGSNNN